MAETLRRIHGWWIADDVPYSVHAGYIAILSLFSFWPFLVGYSNVQRLEQSPMVVGLVSVDNMLASAAAIALIAPLSIDALIDFATRLSNRFKKPQDGVDDSGGSTNILNFVERLIVYAGLLIFPVCAFVRSSNLGLLALCCSRFQFAAGYGGLFLCASRLMPAWFPAKVCMLVTTLLNVSLILMAYTDINGLSRPHGVIVVALALRYIAVAINVMLTLNSIVKRLLVPYCAWRSANDSTSLHVELHVDEENTLDQRYARHRWTRAMKRTVLLRQAAFVAIITVSAGNAMRVSLSSLNVRSVAELGAADLVQINIGFSVFSLMLLVVNLWKTRSDAYLRLSALSRKKADVFEYAFELLDPIRAIYDDLEEMVDKAHPNARDRTAFVTQTDVTVPGASAASGRRDSSTSATVDGPVGGDVPATDLAQLSRRLSETLIAVSAAADRLHDIAEEQAQDDGLPPAAFDMSAKMQQLATRWSRLRRISSVHCSMDGSEHGNSLRSNDAEASRSVAGGGGSQRGLMGMLPPIMEVNSDVEVGDTRSASVAGSSPLDTTPRSLGGDEGGFFESAIGFGAAAREALDVLDEAAESVSLVSSMSTRVSTLTDGVKA